MIVENSLCHIEKLEQRRIRDGVIDITAGLASDHDVTHPHNCELLRDIRRFNSQELAQFIHALLAIAKAVQDSNTDRVSESLEKLRFEVGKLLRHGDYLHAYCNLRISKRQATPRRCAPVSSGVVGQGLCGRAWQGLQHNLDRGED